MKATRFEYRRQTPLHLLLVGLALLTYVTNPDDIVWALVRHHANSAFLERVAFGVATLLVFGSGLLETWVRAYFPDGGPSVRYVLLSRLLLTLALGLLVPFWGAVILVTGEFVLVFRLLIFDYKSEASERIAQSSTVAPRQRPAVKPLLPFSGVGAKWGQAFRKAAFKWGFAASMMVFTFTLTDRIAEIGAAISFVIWIALSPAAFDHLHEWRQGPRGAS